MSGIAQTQPHAEWNNYHFIGLPVPHCDHTPCHLVLTIVVKTNQLVVSSPDSLISVECVDLCSQGSTVPRLHQCIIQATDPKTSTVGLLTLKEGHNPEVVPRFMPYHAIQFPPLRIVEKDGTVCQSDIISNTNS